MAAGSAGLSRRRGATINPSWARVFNLAERMACQLVARARALAPRRVQEAARARVNLPGGLL